MASAISRLRGEWEASTRAKFKIVEMSEAEFISAKRIEADALIYPAANLGLLVERRLLAPLSQEAILDPELDWPDIFESLKSRNATWETTLYAVPFGSPVFTCVYRADVLRHLKLAPPTTWEEWQRLATSLADRATVDRAKVPVGDDWHGAILPLAPGWAGTTLLAWAAPYARHASHYSALFDIETMEPLIAGPPFVRALDELTATSRLGPAEQFDLNPREVWSRFCTGRAGLALTWPGLTTAFEPPVVIVSSESIGFAEVPGSTEVYNPGEGAWEKRDAQQAHVPLLGVAGRLGSVTARSKSKAAAFNLLAWLSGPTWSPRVCRASQSTMLFRASQVPMADKWMGGPLHKAQAIAFAEVVSQSLAGQDSLTVPRIPGRSRYMEALDRAVRQAAKGEIKSRAALDQVAAEWRKITKDLGKKSQRNAYRHSLGLP